MINHQKIKFVKQMSYSTVSKIRKKKEETMRSKDGKRTVGMYPESCREITFVYDDHHKARGEYEWPNDSHLLLSPSRIFDGTKDKSGLEAWRKRVGEEEANRITEEGLSIGKSLHTYLENSIWKFCNVKYQNHPPLINPANHPHARLAAKMGNIILEEGLKDRLEWVYGLEAHIYYSIYYRGIIDLVGTYEGELCIIDFKTKKQMPKEEWTEDWKMQAVAYGMAHNFRCKTHIKKGVILLVTREGEFKRIIIEGDEWNKYYKMFCRKLRDFIVIDRDVKHREYRWAHDRYEEIQKTIKETK
jgi:genome maintenance exonuclease 1